MQFDDRVARSNLTAVLQLDWTALMAPYLNADDAIAAQRLDAESYRINFVYDGQ